MVKDPVCGKKIDKRKARWRISYKHTAYYFCSYKCKKKFEKYPDKYAENDKG